MKRNYDHELTEHSGLKSLRDKRRGDIVDTILNVTIGVMVALVAAKAVQFVLGMF